MKDAYTAIEILRAYMCIPLEMCDLDVGVLTMENIEHHRVENARLRATLDAKGNDNV